MLNDTQERPGGVRGARSATARALLLVAFCLPWFNIVRDNADSAGMLAHLHAYFVDVDLLYDNEYRRLGVAPTFAFVTGEGVVSNHWPAGATWLQAPAYALGLAASYVFAATGSGSARVDALGVLPLLAVRALAMLALGWMMHALAQAFAGELERHRSRCGPVLGAAAFVLGTPVLYYASEAPLRPHLWGCALMLALILLWRARGWGTATERAVVMGGLVGLAAAVRPQLAPAWLLVAEDVWSDTRRSGRGRRLVLAAGSAAAWPLVHVRTQLWMYGGQVSDYAGELTHHLGAFLLSPYHGALAWSPVLVVGLVAVVWAVVQRERAALLLLLLVVHQLWLDSGMRDVQMYRVLGTRTWSGGTSFGARKLVDALPLMLPATLAMTAAVVRRGFGAPLAAVTAVLCAPTVALHAAAFVDPRTTGAVVDARGLGEMMTRAGSAAAWVEAAAARRLPLRAIAVLASVVTLPLVLAAGGGRAALGRAGPQTGVRTAALLLLGGAVAAHAWLSLLMVRSDAALATQPHRMTRARELLHPVHEASVARIPAHHERVRAAL